MNNNVDRALLCLQGPRDILTMLPLEKGEQSKIDYSEIYGILKYINLRHIYIYDSTGIISVSQLVSPS